MSQAASAAHSISVAQTLDLLDAQFREVAEGVAKGEYALWLGSGISRDRVDDLRVIVRRVVFYLSDKASEEKDTGTYTVALQKAVSLVLTGEEKKSIDLSTPASGWNNITNIV